mmetsp:Transcript_11992/g.33182  ORF Transcript_11992/g.33182 Transcript_11992/m.33182 type:complete len:148 (+) Transcript_11992:1159-1602(+)
MVQLAGLHLTDVDAHLPAPHTHTKKKNEGGSRQLEVPPTEISVLPHASTSPYLCRAAQSMHINTPKRQEHHLGFALLQSKHFLFSVFESKRGKRTSLSSSYCPSMIVCTECLVLPKPGKVNPTPRRKKKEEKRRFPLRSQGLNPIPL